MMGTEYNLATCRPMLLVEFTLSSFTTEEKLIAEGHLVDDASCPGFQKSFCQDSSLSTQATLLQAAVRDLELLFFFFF